MTKHTKKSGKTQLIIAVEIRHNCMFNVYTNFVWIEINEKKVMKIEEICIDDTLRAIALFFLNSWQCEPFKILTTQSFSKIRQVIVLLDSKVSNKIMKNPVIRI